MNDLTPEEIEQLLLLLHKATGVHCQRPGNTARQIDWITELEAMVIRPMMQLYASKGRGPADPYHAANREVLNHKPHPVDAAIMNPLVR